MVLEVEFCVYEVKLVGPDSYDRPWMLEPLDFIRYCLFLNVTYRIFDVELRQFETSHL